MADLEMLKIRFGEDQYSTEKENVLRLRFFYNTFFFVKSENFQTAPIGLKLSRKMRLGESFRMVPYTRF